MKNKNLAKWLNNTFKCILKAFWTLEVNQLKDIKEIEKKKLVPDQVLDDLKPKCTDEAIVDGFEIIFQAFSFSVRLYLERIHLHFKVPNTVWVLALYYTRLKKKTQTCTIQKLIYVRCKEIWPYSVHNSIQSSKPNKLLLQTDRLSNIIYQMD